MAAAKDRRGEAMAKAIDFEKHSPSAHYADGRRAFSLVLDPMEVLATDARQTPLPSFAGTECLFGSVLSFATGYRAGRYRSGGVVRVNAPRGRHRLNSIIGLASRNPGGRSIRVADRSNAIRRAGWRQLPFRPVRQFRGHLGPSDGLPMRLRDGSASFSFAPPQSHPAR